MVSPAGTGREGRSSRSSRSTLVGVGIAILAIATLGLETPDYNRSYSMQTETPPDGIEVDLEAAAIVFVDPETDTRLASFPFDEISEAQDEYWSRSFREEANHRAFVFTSDGVDWTIDEMGEALGDRIVTDLEVTEERILAIVIEGAGHFDPSASPGFEVWSAPIP